MLTIRADDLSEEAVKSLLLFHFNDMFAGAPAGTSYSLDLARLADPSITVFSVWDDKDLAGVGALKDLGQGTAEIKSMRTHPAHLRKGVADFLLTHLIQEARRRGFSRLSLETGKQPHFDAALALYRRHGFESGALFGDYADNGFNQFLHLDL